MGLIFQIFWWENIVMICTSFSNQSRQQLSCSTKILRSQMCYNFGKKSSTISFRNVINVIINDVKTTYHLRTTLTTRKTLFMLDFHKTLALNISIPYITLQNQHMPESKTFNHSYWKYLAIHITIITFCCRKLFQKKCENFWTELLFTSSIWKLGIGKV